MNQEQSFDYHDKLGTQISYIECNYLPMVLNEFRMMFERFAGLTYVKNNIVFGYFMENNFYVTQFYDLDESKAKEARIKIFDALIKQQKKNGH